jgi:ABC-type nickel/cobalt efflux system permease component RcnA
MFVLGIGFLLGLKHATDADHVVAVTTILSEHASLFRAGLVGVLWGVGHTASLLLAGLALLFLRVAIPPPVASLLELIVALMIIFLGGRILFLLFRGGETVHVHTHSHGGASHSHLHFHSRDEAHELSTSHDRDHSSRADKLGWRPVVVGVVHGLAGSAAITLLVLTEGALGGSKILGVTYLVVFGVGSIGGMMLMSVLLGLPFVFTSVRFERVNVPLRLVAGIGSVLFGAYYAWNHVLGA